jgi:hypothetical protein
MGSRWGTTGVPSRPVGRPTSAPIENGNANSVLSLGPLATDQSAVTRLAILACRGHRQKPVWDAAWMREDRSQAAVARLPVAPALAAVRAAGAGARPRRLRASSSPRRPSSGEPGAPAMAMGTKTFSTKRRLCSTELCSSVIRAQRRQLNQSFTTGLALRITSRG